MNEEDRDEGKGSTSLKQKIQSGILLAVSLLSCACLALAVGGMLREEMEFRTCVCGAMPSGWLQCIVLLIVAGPVAGWKLIRDAIRTPRDEGTRVSGRAIGCMVFGVANLLFFAVFLVMFAFFVFPAMGRAPFPSGRQYCLNNLRQIDAAKEGAALEMRWTNGTPVANGDRTVNMYIKGLVGTTTTPSCPNGGVYAYNPVGMNPTCSFQGSRPRKVHVSLFWWRYEPNMEDHWLPAEMTRAATMRRQFGR